MHFDNIKKFHTANGVAGYLAKLGVKGYKSNTCDCPVANLLKLDYPDCKIRVSTGEAIVRDSSGRTVFRASTNGTAISNFINDFDCNKFPDLVGQ